MGGWMAASCYDLIGIDPDLGYEERPFSGSPSRNDEQRDMKWKLPAFYTTGS